MTTTKDEDPVVFYAPIPTNPDNSNQNYVVLPLYPHSHLRRRHNHHHHHRYPSLSRCVGVAAAFLLLSTAAFLLYPSDPHLSLVRIHLNHIQILTSPQLSLDLSLSLTLRVLNRDFFSLDYSSVHVTIGYRGRELGFVTSNGGHVKARGSSYVNATLVLDGFEVLHDVVYLIADLARGTIPFDTDSEVNGTVEIFFIDVPIKVNAKKGLTENALYVFDKMAKLAGRLSQAKWLGCPRYRLGLGTSLLGRAASL
ncbi:hypothetical protein TEA_011274 [Camellia sinensis var. sinensis]|uniref:Late embryogenesis abundant protein LEA-2 subgroup domain-containing protein n=1 Tax=Camellia sinensis var. sinensis TaxID=542762 RepID=A0A4S4D833_CAMSN|nr:hypothetical protein TEA_011274 [Camellia sinensis var. sinensis]